MENLFTQLAALSPNLQVRVLQQALSNLHDCASRNGGVSAEDIESFLRSQLSDWAPVPRGADDDAG